MTRLAIVPAIAALCLQQPAFRSGVDVVRVDVSVMRGHTPVAGLTASNFVLTDDGVPQEVTSVELDQLPIRVTLVLDVSGSVAGEKLDHLIDAGQQLVRALHSGDTAALITFSNHVSVDVPPTSDLLAVRGALGSLHGSGATSMNDAIHVALTLRPPDAPRSVIVVFSDGADNLSWTPAAALADETRHSDAVIHAIELRPDPSHIVYAKTAALRAQTFVNGVPILQAVTAASGGRVWSASSSRDLRMLFTSALEEMRARYLLTYTPQQAPQPGWHAVKVSLKDAKRDVTARPGYFVEGK
jgi:VWFA-related protein